MTGIIKSYSLDRYLNWYSEDTTGVEAAEGGVTRVALWKLK